MLEKKSNLKNKLVQRKLQENNKKAPNYLPTTKTPPNGAAIGIEKLLVVDACTTSPPSKSFTLGSRAVNVAESYSDAENRKFVIEPLSCNSYQHNRCSKGIDNSVCERTFISEPYIRKQDMSITDSCCNCVEETLGSSTQQKVSKGGQSFASTNNSCNSPENTTGSYIALHNVDIDNHRTNSNKSGNSNLTYVKIIKSNSNNYKFQSILSPTSGRMISDISNDKGEKMISEVEDISKTRGKSSSSSPVTACERLL